MTRRIFKYIGFIAVAQAAGIIGAYFTADAIPMWYAGLAKPVFAPPNWLFAPVWVSLYFLMGVAAARVWELRAGKASARRGISWYWTQLALNTVWSPIFFGMKNIGLALTVIILLWVGIFMTIQNFWKADKWAAILLMPYIAWVSFAAILNTALFILN